MVTKIFLVGGSGKIGQEVFKLIKFQTTSVENVDIVLYSPNNRDKLVGRSIDIDDAFALMDMPSKNVNFIFSDKYSDMAGSDIIINCSGIWPTEEQYKELAEKGIDDRHAQSFANAMIIEKTCKNVRAYCSAEQTKFIMVTNQVDCMTEYARELLPGFEVYGIGCTLDTIRFRNILKHKLLDTDYDLSKLNEIYMIARHNGTMMPYPERLLEEIPEEALQSAIEETKGLGLKITTLSKDIHEKVQNTGAFTSPAVMICRMIEALTGGRKFTTPLVRKVLKNELCAEETETYAQMLCEVIQNTITPVEMVLTEKEKILLKNNINTFNEEYKNFKSKL